MDISILLAYENCHGTQQAKTVKGLGLGQSCQTLKGSRSETVCESALTGKENDLCEVTTYLWRWFVVGSEAGQP